MRTTFDKDDVILMLQDLTGKLKALDTEEREKAIQSGVHYSEMLPKEYKPSEIYMKIFEESLTEISREVAYTVRVLAEKIINYKGKNVVLVSLARAGTPIGVLLKHYIKYKYNVNVPHYTVSIIRDKGIDETAITAIVSLHGAENIQFIDGWVGKGKISQELTQSVKHLTERFNCCKGLSDTLGVLTDPANVTELCGTRMDILIPSACLNATVTGLISRTIYTTDGFHGAVYFEEMKDYDRTYQFIGKVEEYFNDDLKLPDIKVDGNGMDEVERLMEQYHIKDINKIKPGIGETTRVLLRRVPDFVIIDTEKIPYKYYRHILQLCNERDIRIKHQNLEMYGVVGVIKEVLNN